MNELSGRFIFHESGLAGRASVAPVCNANSLPVEVEDEEDLSSAARRRCSCARCSRSRVDGIRWSCVHRYACFCRRFKFCLSNKALKDSLSSDVYFAWKDERDRLDVSRAPFGDSVVSTEPATDAADGVSLPVYPSGVSATGCPRRGVADGVSNRVFRAVLLLLLLDAGRAASRSFCAASAIQESLSDSRAARYSCCA